MKILVFEYITGGGFNKQSLPDSLAKEGCLMLNALLDNLARLNSHEIWLMLDWRVKDLVNMVGINPVIINPEHNATEEFARLAKQCDGIWPIAPEFDGILLALCQIVEQLGKPLLTSPALPVAVAGNKFETFELLNRYHIAVVPTQMLTDTFIPGEWMIKPIDGVGCADSHVVTHQHDFERIEGAQAEYIIQPHLQGEKTSLSCLFKQGRGWLLCANRQRFNFIDNQYHLAEIVVNHHNDSGAYQQLIDKIALVLPALWGYVGIDLIETAEQLLVLEINPRLTTSFVGIYDALGINVAKAVLQLLQGEPALNPAWNRSITVQTNQETNAS